MQKRPFRSSLASHVTHSGKPRTERGCLRRTKGTCGVNARRHDSQSGNWSCSGAGNQRVCPPHCSHSCTRSVQRQGTAPSRREICSRKEKCSRAPGPGGQEQTPALSRPAVRRSCESHSVAPNEGPIGTDKVKREFCFLASEILVELDPGAKLRSHTIPRGNLKRVSS